MIANQIVKSLSLNADQELMEKIVENVKDIRGEISKILMKNISFPSHHYWRIFEEIVFNTFNLNDAKNKLQEKLVKHFNAAVEACVEQETLSAKLAKLSEKLSNPDDKRLQELFTHGQSL